MKIQELSSLCNDDGPVYHELRRGKLVSVTRARLKYSMNPGSAVSWHPSPHLARW